MNWTLEAKASSEVSKRRIIWIYSTLLLVCILLFVASVGFVVWQSVKQAEGEFQQYSHQVHQSLSQTFAINETIMDGFAAFLADVGMQDPNRARFYTKTMMERYPQLYMFQAAQRVSGPEIPEFEQKMSIHLDQKLEVVRFAFGEGLMPVNTQALINYYPVVFVEPTFADGLNILGLDISSIQFIEEAMHKALKTNLSSISQLIELSDGSEAFVLIKPSLLPGQEIPDNYALLVIKNAALLQDLKPQEAGIYIELGYPDADPIMSHATPPIPQWQVGIFPKFVTTKTIDVGASDIRLLMTRQVSFNQINITLIFVVSVIALAVCLLVFMYMRMHLEAERVKQLAAIKLYEQANYDRLTGLANRHFFEDQFARSLAGCQRRNSKMALLYIDLNDFKPVNDTYGHQVGDAMLATASAIILQSIRADDVAARFGGDEFVVMLQHVTMPDDAKNVVKRLNKLLDEVEYVEGQNVTLSASIGISVFPDDGNDFDQLIKTADQRMYEDKRKRKNKGNIIELDNRR